MNPGTPGQSSYLLPYYAALEDLHPSVLGGSASDESTTSKAASSKSKLGKRARAMVVDQTCVSEDVRKLKKFCDTLPTWKNPSEEDVSSATSGSGNSYILAATSTQRCPKTLLEEAKNNIFRKICAEDIGRLSNPAQNFLKDLTQKSEKAKANLQFRFTTIKRYQTKALRFIRFIEQAGIAFNFSYVAHYFQSLEKIYNDAWESRKKCQDELTPTEIARVQQVSKDTTLLTCRLTEGFRKFFFDGIIPTSSNKTKASSTGSAIQPTDPLNAEFPATRVSNTAVASKPVVVMPGVTPFLYFDLDANQIVSAVPLQRFLPEINNSQAKPPETLPARLPTPPARLPTPPVIQAKATHRKTGWVDELLNTYEALAGQLTAPPALQNLLAGD